MPDFWQFPTGSMGLGPLFAIYQARFMRYLEHRGHAKTAGRKVWAFVGDGEMDEPESLAGLSVAARERLDNLVLVVNCNLQRLDGPVRGNGSIVQELEGLFAGAGWNVIKVLWGGDWDPLFARDTSQLLEKRFAETVDGEFQTYAATDGRFNREHFFNSYPELQSLAAHLSDDDIDRLRRGGHDPVKIFSAYWHAARHEGQPTVILAQTKKGYGMGTAGQGRMTTHQQKKLDTEELFAFRERFALPLTDAQVRGLRVRPPAARIARDGVPARAARKLGGYLPGARGDCEPASRRPRRARSRSSRSRPAARRCRRRSPSCAWSARSSRTPALGRRIVPIIADEARTFGMADLFRQIGIYSPLGQLYQPEDREQLSFYKEAVDGQILEEGINEAGAIASWVAAATSYSAHGHAMLPMYIYYSMFGFQRVGDAIWAAADSRSRGFLRRRHGRAHHALRRGPAAPGRHEPPHRLDHPQLPRLRPGLRLRARRDPRGRHAPHAHGAGGRLLLRDGDERELRAALACRRAREEGILRGMYRVRERAGPKVRLLGAGTILPEAMAAAELLERDWQVAAEVYLGHELHGAAPRGDGGPRDRRGWAARPRRPGSSSQLPKSRRAGRRRERLRERRGGPHPSVGARSVLRRWGRTASGAATRASGCGASSRSTGMRSRWRRCTPSAMRGADEAVKRYGVDAGAEAPWRR